MLTSRFTMDHVKRYGQIAVKPSWTIIECRKCQFIDGLMEQELNKDAIIN